MSKLIHLISNDDTFVEKDNDEPYIINEQMLENYNNMDLEELEANSEFYNNIGLAFFGQVIIYIQFIFIFFETYFGGNPI